MLTRFSILFLSIGFFTFGQDFSEPTYYLNKKVIDFKKVYIFRKGIDSISMKKNGVNEIYITTKEEKFTYLTIDEIIKKYSKEKIVRGSTLFKINGKIIQDTSGVKIDNLFYIHIEIDSFSNYNYLSDNYKSLKIFNIILKEESDYQYKPDR
jgi:hypothetical protein